MGGTEMLCSLWSEAVSHQLYPIKKLTVYTRAGDVGSQIDRSIIGGISTTIIDLGYLMDPITFLLLFNITVWLYWTVK